MGSARENGGATGIDILGLLQTKVMGVKKHNPGEEVQTTAASRDHRKE